MIHINLLPPELRPIKRTPVPYILSLLVVVLVILGLGYLHASTLSQIAYYNSQYEQHTKEYNKLAKVVEDYNNMIELKRSLRRKIETINGIVKDRIIWSRQLYNLSRILPENFWYDSISVDTKRETETRYEVNPKTKKVEPKQVPIVRKVLTVSGYVIEGDEGLDVSPLVKAAEEDQEFSKMFQLEPPQIKDTTIDGQPVKSFTLQFDIQGQGDSQS